MITVTIHYAYIAKSNVFTNMNLMHQAISNAKTAMHPVNMFLKNQAET